MVAAIFLTRFLYKHNAIYSKGFNLSKNVLISITFWSSRNQKGLYWNLRGPGFHKVWGKVWQWFLSVNLWLQPQKIRMLLLYFPGFCCRLSYIVFYLQVSIITSFTRWNTKTIPCESKISRTNLFCYYCLPSFHTVLLIYKNSRT